jgi:hypothetical protein
MSHGQGHAVETPAGDETRARRAGFATPNGLDTAVPAQLSVSLKHFTISLTLREGVVADVDEAEVRLAVIDGLRRRGICGASGFEVTVSEPTVTGPAEYEPATRRHSAPAQDTVEAIAHAWSIAAKAVVDARISERTGRPSLPAPTPCDRR